MNSGRTNYAAIFSRLAALSLLLTGCGDPFQAELSSLQPKQGVQGTQIEMVLRGRYFTEKHEVFIDGVRGAEASGVTLVGLARESSTVLIATLKIEPTAAARAYNLTVVNQIDPPGRITDPLTFHVTCSGCGAPELLAVTTEGLETLYPLFPSSDPHILRLVGRNLSAYQPRVLVSDSTVKVHNDQLETGVDLATNLDFIRIPILAEHGLSVAAIHELSVRTTGGLSNSLEIVVGIAFSFRPEIYNVTIGRGLHQCLRRGSNELALNGTGFDESTRVEVRFVDGDRAYTIHGVETELLGPGEIRTKIEIDQDVPSSLAAIIDVVGRTGRGSYSLCSGPNRPILSSVTPERVTQGTTVFVRCEGTKLAGGEVLVNQGQGVTVEEVLDPVDGSAEESKVAKLRIDATAGPSVALWIKNAAGETTMPKLLEIVPPGNALIESVSPDFVGRGTPGVDVEVRGRRLAGAGAIRFSNRLVEISNVRIDPSFELVTFHVRADTDAPLTNDAATNLIAGNPLAFRVVPPGTTPSASPTLTTLTPARVTKGSFVFVKLEGSGFGQGAALTTDPFVSSSSNYARAVSNPDRVVVAGLRIPDNIGSPLLVRVLDAQGNLSNELPLHLDDPEPGAPLVREPEGTIFPGAVTSVILKGVNLQGANDGSWHPFPHLQFSNTSGTATRIDARVNAGAGAALTGDEATNFRITTPAGTSNLFGLEIRPAFTP